MKRTIMSSVRSIIDRMLKWVAANARSFSYLLPDALELVLYLGPAYFAVQLVQDQA